MRFAPDLGSDANGRGLPFYNLVATRMIWFALGLGGDANGRGTAVLQLVATRMIWFALGLGSDANGRGLPFYNGLLLELCGSRLA